MSSLDHVITSHGGAEGSFVKLQLSVLEEDEELTADALRFDTLKKFLSASERIKEAKGLSLYISSRRATSTFEQGKTVVIPGLKGINVFQDDLKWAPVFGRSGLCFVLLDQPVGLIWGDEEPAVYVKKLSELKEALGTGSIVFVNESCLWSDKTKEALLDVFLEIAKADFDRRALSNIFSGNLMRIIDLARGIQDSGFSF
jgi:hypothetical protein